MSTLRERLGVGWQSSPGAAAVVATFALAGGSAAGVALGLWPGLTVAFGVALAALGRMQWARLEGGALLLRESRTRYLDRAWPARHFAGLRYRRGWLPWARLAIDAGDGAAVLVVVGRSPRHPDLRALTLWMIVHGRRRARIDPRLLDALAAMPEHGPARQPHDASPA